MDNEKPKKILTRNDFRGIIRYQPEPPKYDDFIDRKPTNTKSKISISMGNSYEDPERVYTIEYLGEKNKDSQIKLRVGELYKINHLETSMLVEPRFVGEYIYNGIVFKDDSRKNVYLSFTCIQEECDDGVSLKLFKSKVKSPWSTFSKAKSNTQHLPIELSAEETSGINPKYFFELVDGELPITAVKTKNGNQIYTDPNQTSNEKYFGGKRRTKITKKRRSRKSRRNHARKTRSKTRK